jgi:hypothetical protein
MLSLEKQALKQMQEYHENSKITVDNPQIARQIKWAIKLLNIADETDFVYVSSGDIFTKGEFKDWVTTYINTNNWRRFFTPNHLYEKTDWSKPCFQVLVRSQKAWYLHNKLRYYYGFNWWD